MPRTTARTTIEARGQGRPRARVRARRGRSGWSRSSSARSSTSPSRSTCAPASTSATPTSSCAARSRCPTAWARSVTIAVFAKGDKAREAEEAGADIVGAEDLAKRVQDGFTDFDVAIATPDMMPVVGRLGRILGPQGKMPNPKVGTVTHGRRQGGRGVQGRQGRVPHRPHRDRAPRRSARPSFEERALLENYAAVIDELIRAKPSAAKGRYIRSITLASTMGPGVKVDPSRTRDLLEEAAPAAA